MVLKAEMARRKRFQTTVLVCVAVITLLQCYSLGGNLLEGLGHMKGLWTSSSTRKRRIIHVINAYAAATKIGTNKTTSSLIYHPLTFDQWYTIASIQRAKQRPPPDFEVEFVCAIFESDREALRDLPCRKVILHRSTLSKYPFLTPPKQLAFVQDVIDATIAGKNLGLKDPNSEFYLIVTNADIGLTQNFFHFVVDNMENREAISINRMTLPSLSNNTESADSSTLLGAIDMLFDNYTSHPGFDCFVMRSSVLARVRFGDMFIGYPPWGSNVHVALQVMAFNYTNIDSNINGTFHIGNEMEWASQSRPNDVKEAIRKVRNITRECPSKSIASSMHMLMNTVNCGRWFRSNRIFNNHTIPSFVQPGYESLYLQNYPNVYHYRKPNGRGYLIFGSKSSPSNSTTMKRSPHEDLGRSNRTNPHAAAYARLQLGSND